MTLKTAVLLKIQLYHHSKLYIKIHIKYTFSFHYTGIDITVRSVILVTQTSLNIILFLLWVLSCPHALEWKWAKVRPRLHRSVRVSCLWMQNSFKLLSLRSTGSLFYIYIFWQPFLTPFHEGVWGVWGGKRVLTCLPPPQAHTDPDSHLQTANNPTHLSP